VTSRTLYDLLCSMPCMSSANRCTLANTMVLDNVGDILCVSDEGPMSKHEPQRCAYPQFTYKWWVCPDYKNLCLISVVGGELVERSITDIEALLKHIQHNTMINSIECCRHVQQHKSSDVTSVNGCHVVVQVHELVLSRSSVECGTRTGELVVTSTLLFA